MSNKERVVELLDNVPEYKMGYVLAYVQGITADEEADDIFCQRMGVIMHKYERIIYWSKDDEAFIVEVPELPGCMADGKTIQEAVQNAEVVIDEWIEVAMERGQEIPEPKGKLVYA